MDYLDNPRGRAMKPPSVALRQKTTDLGRHRDQHEVAAAVALGAKDAVVADLLRRAEGSGDVAVRQRTGDG